MKIMFPGMVIVGLIGFHLSNAQSDCAIRKDSEGIKVYSCAVEDSKFKSIRASFDLEAKVGQLISVLRDVESYSKWQYRMVNPKLVREDRNSITYYAEIYAPWPVTNRDMIVTLNFSLDTLQNILVVNAIGEPTSLPLVEGIVRVPSFKAKWMVRETAHQKLQIEYDLIIDIGGAVPAWIINMAQAEGPFETFSGLRKHLKSRKYKS